MFQQEVEMMQVKAIKKSNSDKDANVYNFSTDDISNLTQRVFLRNDVRYRNKSPSNRHRGLTPMMIAILMLIHKASRIAEKRGMEFVGLTLYDCQKAFVFCGISNDTVRDNIKRLVRMGFLRQVIIVKKGKKSLKMAFYIIDTYKFPCKDGLWLIGETGMNSGTGFFPQHCRFYPFCTGSPIDCKIVEHFTTLRNVLTNKSYDEERLQEDKASGKGDPFMENLRDRLSGWIEDYYEQEKLRSNLPNLLATKEYAPTFFVKNINEDELDYLVWEIIISKKDGTYETKMSEIRNVIIAFQKKKQEKECRKSARKGNSSGDEDDDQLEVGASPTFLDEDAIEE